MTLADLLEHLDSLDDDLTIYAEKNPEWSAQSKAIACLGSDARQVPEKARGLTYLLEVDLAKEVVESWAGCHEGREPTIQEKCEAVIYYAENDAYLPS